MLTLMKLTCVWIACAFPGVPDEELATTLAAGRFDRALRRGDILLSSPGAAPGDRREHLVELRARCLFELGDYPSCEKTLRSLLDSVSPAGRRKAALLAQVARLCSYQQAHTLAAETITRALKLDDSPQLRQVAVSIALRTRDHEAALPHLEVLLDKSPDDPRTIYYRGLVQLRRGEYQGAITSLRRGLELKALEKEARFELAMALRKSGKPREALAHLIDSLEAEPTLEPACYQASRCLLEIGGPRQVRVSAWLLGYFKALKNAADPSSRDHHLLAAGKAAEAWLARASAREPLGDFSGALRNQQRAASLSPASPMVNLHRARFFLRRGLLAEARKPLEPLEPPPRELQLKLRERASALGELNDGPGKEALLRLAACDWDTAEKPLEAALENTRRTDPSRAADLARLLLAKNPSSGDALRFLIRHTTDPQLIIPRLHYLGRLSRADPGNTGLREELATLRKLLLGS